LSLRTDRKSFEIVAAGRVSIRSPTKPPKSRLAHNAQPERFESLERADSEKVVMPQFDTADLFRKPSRCNLPVNVASSDAIAEPLKRAVPRTSSNMATAMLPVS
jgi:hypothetical protein